METLEARVERLERSNRRLKRGICLGATACLAVVLVGQGRGKPMEIVASRVALTDDEGRLLGAFGLAEGKPLLFLSSANGRARVAMCVENDDKVWIDLATKSFGASIHFAIQGGASFLRFDQDGKPTIVAFSALALDPRITVARPNGDSLWKTPFREP